ncbi:MAG: RNA polymerase sigma factor [Muribaculaceae bacterium]|nr:RNA polymerase sigma factor [Muribaculaceae bacterium]MDE6343556.1 RNA polymerase sigma factor [Muribaculaceae bacterium]MDE6610542.1 RNA polymerase sigma factor [Muribaculaceae bacterium]
MLTRLQELSLIARCVAADDRRAFGQLVAAYSDNLRRFLLSLTGGDVSLVDDLAQETFIKAYLSIRSLKGISRFRTWLFRIAYNEFVSHTRRTRHIDPLTDIDNIDIVDDTDDENLITDTTLSEAIMKLTEPQRAVVQLFYFEGLSVARISTVTGQNQSTVKSHLNRARIRLASLLEKYRY